MLRYLKAHGNHTPAKYVLSLNLEAVHVRDKLGYYQERIRETARTRALLKEASAIGEAAQLGRPVTEISERIARLFYTTKRGGVLTETIPTIRKNRALYTFERRQRVAAAVVSEFESCGSFFRTFEGRAYFFEKSEKKLYALESSGFARLLAERTGLNCSELEFRYVVEHLMTYVVRGAREVEVHRLVELWNEK